MERINIQTAQNVYIQHNMASVGDRLLAAILDYLFLFLYFILLILVSNYVVELPKIGFIIFFLLPILLYDVFFEYFFDGQSPGKMILKIKVVQLNGSENKVSNYLIRWSFRLIDIGISLGSIGMLSIIFSKKGQRIGDMAAGTIVVKLSSKETLGETILQKLPDDYRVVFEEVNNLNDNDLRIINDLLENVKANSYSRDSVQLLEMARVEINKKLGIESELPSEQFFKQLLKDYSYLYRS